MRCLVPKKRQSWVIPRGCPVTQRSSFHAISNYINCLKPEGNSVLWLLFTQIHTFNHRGLIFCIWGLVFHIPRWSGSTSISRIGMGTSTPSTWVYSTTSIHTMTASIANTTTCVLINTCSLLNKICVSILTLHVLI